MSNQPPLEGLTVLDFIILLLGLWGDYGRNMPPLKKNYSPLFLILNRNIESLAIDYTQKLLIPLFKKADILLESFRPG